MMSRFSYLFISYDSRRYYWEGINTIWSSLVVIFALYIPFDSTQSQTFSIIFIPFGMLLLQYIGQPYFDDYLDGIAMRSIQCLIVSAVCCLGLRSGSQMRYITSIYHSILWISNGFLIIYIILSLREEATTKMGAVIKSMGGDPNRNICFKKLIACLTPKKRGRAEREVELQ
eukprot:TRINITY_DN7100_c0_g2_i5.p1 TRINITY_DN7100_c0_g2~~TRINITY_DN7100_c0_g2_i5.p1  ORF type:complete len:172 (-),score=9.87 TRINITY_DN7100_c0_g2_i5:134-649(-)